MSKKDYTQNKTDKNLNELLKQYNLQRDTARKYQRQYEKMGVSYQLPKKPKKITVASVRNITKYTEREYIEQKLQREDIMSREQRAEVVVENFLTEALKGVSPVVDEILRNTILFAIDHYGVTATGEQIIRQFPSGVEMPLLLEKRGMAGSPSQISGEAALLLSQKFLKVFEDEDIVTRKLIEDIVDAYNVYEIEEDEHNAKK